MADMPLAVAHLLLSNPRAFQERESRVRKHSTPTPEPLFSPFHLVFFRAPGPRFRAMVAQLGFQKIRGPTLSPRHRTQKGKVWSLINYGSLVIGHGMVKLPGWRTILSWEDGFSLASTRFCRGDEAGYVWPGVGDCGIIWPQMEVGKSLQRIQPQQLTTLPCGATVFVHSLRM